MAVMRQESGGSWASLVPGTVTLSDAGQIADEDQGSLSVTVITDMAPSLVDAPIISLSLHSLSYCLVTFSFHSPPPFSFPIDISQSCLYYEG